MIVTVVGGVMLGASFMLAYQLYQVYFGIAQSNFASISTNGFIPSLSNLLLAAVVVMFIGLMGWIGSIFLLRGVDFMKVDRGVGIVTFKVDKGVGMVTGMEVTGDTKKIDPSDPTSQQDKS
jgi:hypothetical protein